MVEPEVKAARIEALFPWLLHWCIADSRIGGFRSDSFAVNTPDGLMVIDALPLEERLEKELAQAAGLFLTHGNHQRSAWRLRREIGAPVYAPVGATGLDETPDVWFDDTTELPGDLRAVKASGFEGACYLVFTHVDGTGALFCGDLICQDPDGPYRFPVQPGYFDLAGGREDAWRLLELPVTALCAAHAAPSPGDCHAALQGALDRAGN